MNILAVAYGTLVTINIAWPRNSIYNAVGTPHWYWQWAPFLFIGGVVIIGTLYYFLVQSQQAPGGARGASGRHTATTRARASGRCGAMIDAGEPTTI